MKKEKIDYVEFVDDKLIEKAEKYSVVKPKNSWVKYAAVAACICLAIGVGTTQFSNKIKVGSEEKPAAIISDNANAHDIEKPLADNTKEQTKETLPEESNGDVEVSGKNIPVTQPYFTNDHENDNNLSATQKADSKNNIQTQISRFGEMRLYSEYSDQMSVANGMVVFAQGLANALAANGDSVTYRVFVAVFKDGKEVPVDTNIIENEIAKYSKAGYTTAIETHGIFNETELSSKTYFTINSATEEQLSRFMSSENYGFYLMLYDEYFGVQTQDEAVINSGFETKN